MNYDEDLEAQDLQRVSFDFKGFLFIFMLSICFNTILIVIHSNRF